MHGCMLDLCTCMKVYNNNVETRRMIDVYTQLHSSYVHEWMTITHNRCDACSYNLKVSYI